MYLLEGEPAVVFARAATFVVVLATIILGIVGLFVL
jgi:hypothetical protein